MSRRILSDSADRLKTRIWHTTAVGVGALVLAAVSIAVAGLAAAASVEPAIRVKPAIRVRPAASVRPAAQVRPAASTPERTVVIGRSVRGRAITAIVRGPGSAKRKLLIVGCIHGNECAGLAIIRALQRSPVRAGVQLWLVGEMNPDGTAADTRQNAHGVDLNRNFPYQWQHVTNPVYYSGPAPASEPETRAAIKLIRAIKPAVTIWYHQHEDLVDMAGGDRGVPRRYAQLARLRATCLPFLPGTAPGWSNHEFPGTTSFVVELPAGAVSASALTDHLRAVRAMERGERSGSRTSCAS
jgi:murein peptide amidase A